MIKETISRIEQEIKSSESLSSERREEILELIDNLKQEMQSMGEANDEDVRTVVSYTETSIREAMRKEQNPELLHHSLQGLSLSVKRFEVSHPKLVGVINNIGHSLSTLGI